MAVNDWVLTSLRRPARLLSWWRFVLKKSNVEKVSITEVYMEELLRLVDLNVTLNIQQIWTYLSHSFRFLEFLTAIFVLFVRILDFLQLQNLLCHFFIFHFSKCSIVIFFQYSQKLFFTPPTPLPPEATALGWASCSWLKQALYGLWASFRLS